MTPVELKEQLAAPTLASMLGEVPHFSGLRQRIARASGTGDRVAEWLLKVAVLRGATHYEREFDPSLPPDVPSICDEEIGVALCLGQHAYNLDHLRAASQLLSSPKVNAARLCRLAIKERCEPILLHFAEVAQRFAPHAQPWAFLREHLRPRLVARSDALPHWSRLVSHTGVTANVGPSRTDWLHRHE